MPRLFDTTKNAVFWVYVALKRIYTFICKKIKHKTLSLLGFTKQLPYSQLAIESISFVQ